MAEVEKEASNKVENEPKTYNQNQNETTQVQEEEDGKGMKPWEQHAAVISIPRFDYNAPSALLSRSHSGFLVTCSIKREKSATKEVISILQKYIGSNNRGTSNSSEPSNGDQSSPKRRKTMCADGVQSECASKEADDAHSEDAHLVEDTGRVLSLVKLTRSGLLLLTFSGENTPDASDIVSNIYQTLESGNLKSPLFCHRIFPIQATCCLNEKDLRTVVSKLVREFINGKHKKLEQPLKFAVGFNRRGLEETQAKNEKDALKDSNTCSLLDRNKCFSVVASAVKEIVSDSAVDLKSPELVIFVELLPLSGVPNGSLVAAVSVLPQNLVNAKPKLCIKPLVCDTKAKKRKG